MESKKQNKLFAALLILGGLLGIGIFNKQNEVTFLKYRLEQKRDSIRKADSVNKALDSAIKYKILLQNIVFK